MNGIRNFILGLLLIGLIISTVHAELPDVTLETPDEGETLSGTINLTATATDTDGFIIQVNFSYNNNDNDAGWVNIGSNTTSSGESYYIKNWDTIGLPDGNNYSFKAEATDNNSETADDTSDAVTIANNQNPTVSLVSPVSESTVTKLVILNATAIDSDGSISNVTFEYKLNSSSSWAGPYPYDNKSGNFYLKDWDTETIVNGTYDIKVIATDNDSATNISITSGIIVDNQPNVLPVVTINVPKNGQTYNGTVELNATATDEDGIITDITFEYYNGSGWNSLGSNTSKSGYYYYRDWVTDSLDNGDNYKIRANATDNGTKTGTYTTGTFSIDNSIDSSHLPKLSNGGATPDNGITPQEFEFNVTYTDDDNESATYVCLVIDGVGTYNMSATDSNNPKDGIVYNYSKTLNTTTSSTTYKYHFIARDVNGSDASNTSEKSVEVYSKTYYSGNRIWDEDANLSTTYTWDPQSFSGFYYDLDTDEGSETLNIKNIDRSLKGGEIEYETKPIPVEFENDRWGTYEVIGFMADRYFAGYTENTTFASDSDSLLDEDKLSRVLTDNDKKVRLNSGSVLELEDGYEFKITQFSISGDKIIVGLFKDGDEVYEEVIEEDDTFVYEKDLGKAEDMPIIAIYIDNVFIGQETSSVNIEGIFQISDEYIDVEDGDEFGLMEITKVNSKGIIMENEDSVSLGEGDDFNLMGKINIIVADNSTLRFAPYVDMTEPGTYELRGTVTEAKDFKWTPLNFEALMYDIDTGEGDETLHLKRDGRTVDEDDLTYTINPITKDFEHSSDEWNSFKSIGFMGETYFAGYLEESAFVSDDVSLIKEGKLSKVLMDEDKKHTLYIGNSLSLEDGYSVCIDEISQDGDDLMLSILKDGEELSTEIVGEDDDLVYDIEVDKTDIPIIVIHIDKAFAGMERSSVHIEGIFQISDSFTSVEKGDTYGIMEVIKTTPSIVLSNEDDSISLDEGDVIDIMGDIKIKVADDGDVRFYPYQEIIVEEPLFLELDIPDSIHENEEFTISVTSDGDKVGNVSITFNDTGIGSTDSDGELIHTPTETGKFEVTASKSGYKSDSKNIEVLYQPKTLEISAPSMVDKGETIVISVTHEGEGVSGVTVMFGSNDLGTTPASGDITHTPDQIGTHTITASKSGYQDASKDIDITDPSVRPVYSNLTIEPERVEPGEKVNITVIATNLGTFRDTDTMVMKVNGEEVMTKDLDLGPGESTTIKYTLNRSEPGTYLVEVDGQSGTFKVKGGLFNPTTIAILAILAILFAIAIIYSFARGILSFGILKGKAQGFEESLRRLKEK